MTNDINYCVLKTQNGNERCGSIQDVCMHAFMCFLNSRTDYMPEAVDCCRRENVQKIATFIIIMDKKCSKIVDNFLKCFH